MYNLGSALPIKRRQKAQTIDRFVVMGGVLRSSAHTQYTSYRKGAVTSKILQLFNECLVCIIC